MNMDLIQFRSPTLEDAPAVLELMITCDIAEYGAPDSELSDLLDDWSAMDLANDVWLAEKENGNLLGYAGIYVDARSIFHFDLYVHPNQLDKTLMEILIEKCEQRSRTILSEKGIHKVIASLIVSTNNENSKSVVEELGFSAALHHFGMSIHFEKEPLIPQWSPEQIMRTAIPGKDDQMIYEFIQHAFDKPGRVPPSFEDWRETMLGASNFDPGLWFLLYHQNELVGAALCFAYPEYGWIRQIAVDPAQRGRGLGSKLLQYTFSVFSKRGLKSVRLGVESDNENAFRLYEQVGMHCTSSYVDYRKDICTT